MTTDNRIQFELNRPEARNALSPDMMSQLGQAIASCRAGDIRAVLLTGTDRAFCAGADVRRQQIAVRN